MEFYDQSRRHLMSLLGIAMGISLLIAGCSPGTQLLNKIPVHSVEFKVADQNGDPISGAYIESSNGKSTSTNGAGMATLRFGSVGIHTVTVTASNHMPSTMTVTLPSDDGTTKNVRLTEQIEYSGISAGMGMPSAQLYPMMFTWMFNTFGYNMEISDYDEGEWTKWKITTSDEDDALVMRKAFLKELDNGQQWWQLQWFQDDGEHTYTAEILFDPNRSSIRRYREKIDDNEAQEKPVQEGWYSKPNELTPESIEGAVTETDISVEVPKGTFTADLIDFGVAPEVSLLIWRVTDVPGGTVKYKTQHEEDLVYQSQLVDYGSDAKTMLDSY